MIKDRVSLLAGPSHQAYQGTSARLAVTGTFARHASIAAASEDGFVSPLILSVAWTDVLTGMQTSLHSSHVSLAVNVIGPEGTFASILSGTSSMVSPL